MGSSATAVLIGVIAATTLQPEFETKDTWLQISAELEGHADNVAAAIFGGLISVRKTENEYKALLCDVEPENAVVILPCIDLPTHTTRAALPKMVLWRMPFPIYPLPAILEGLRWVLLSFCGLALLTGCINPTGYHYSRGCRSH